MIMSNFEYDFSNSVQTYDSFSDVQQKSAEILCDFSYSFIKKNDLILDLGCGSGHIKNQLLKLNLPDINLLSFDISLKMLKYFKHSLAINGDFSKLPFKNEKFDIILSSFSLQWSRNLLSDLKGIYNILKYEKFFCFALPNSDSFYEIKLSNEKSQSNFNFLDLYSSETIKNAIENSNLTIIDTKNIKITKKYDSAIDFIQKIKKIGATIKTNNNRFINRRKIKFFNEYFATNFNNQASWNIDFFILQKTK